MIRTLALIAALGGFTALAVIDLSNGQTTTGAAALLLALANGLLLT